MKFISCICPIHSKFICIYGNWIMCLRRCLFRFMFVLDLSKVLFHFQVTEVKSLEDDSPAKYSSEVIFYVDKYEIV